MPVHNLGSKHELIGREDFVRSLRESIRNAAKQTLVLFGPAGIGKSAIVTELGYELTGRQRLHEDATFDYVLFMTARLRRIHVSYLLDEVARWTGNTYIMRLTDQNQKQVEILKILSRIPVCLILDNLETTTDKTDL